MATRTRSGWIVVLLLLAAVAGIAAGWLLPAERERTFAYLRALLVPGLIALVCSQALAGTTKRHRWLLPLLLGLAIVDIVTHPHVPPLSALSITAAVIATLASLRDRKATAMAAAVVACLAISASLLLGLAWS